MKVSEKGAPAAAIIAALSTLACCLPLGFFGAVGLASLSLWARQYSRWLLLGAIAFLCVGSVQLYFRKSCTKKSKATLVLFWAAVVIVILVALFPQLVATLIAG
jgi:TRAP-type C4-dicarboxylate transport system permease small subunit